MVFTKINALKILMPHPDENDERTRWLGKRVVVWVIFKPIGLCLERYLFSSLAKFSFQTIHNTYIRKKMAVNYNINAINDVLLDILEKIIVMAL